MPSIPNRTRRAVLGGGLSATVAVTAVSAQQFQGGAPAGSTTIGLRPDPDQDQTAVLQRALSAAAKNRAPVYLPSGRYRMGGISLPPWVRLFGTGSGATILVQAGTAPLFAAQGGQEIALHGITLEGGPVATRTTPLVSFTDVKVLDMSDVVLVLARGPAVRLERCGGRIERCSISDAEVGIFSLDATGLRIVGNVVDRCRNNGIQVWRSQKGYDGTQVLANRVSNVSADAGGSGQNGNGVNVFRAGGVMVAQNVIRDCAFTAVRNNSGDNVQILGNSCLNLGEVAIYAEFTFEGCIIANNLVDRANVGVSITNFNENGRLAVATGNIVRNLFRRLNPEKGTYDGGTGIAVEADATVTGNVVEGAELAGIKIGYGTYQRDVLCSGNVVRRCAYGITVSVVPDSGTAQITNNILSECSRGRVVGFEYDKVVSGDLADSVDRRFRHLAVHGNTGR